MSISEQIREMTNLLQMNNDRLIELEWGMEEPIQESSPERYTNGSAANRKQNQPGTVTVMQRDLDVTPTEMHTQPPLSQRPKRAPRPRIDTFLTAQEAERTGEDDRLMNLKIELQENLTSSPTIQSIQQGQEELSQVMDKSRTSDNYLGELFEDDQWGEEQHTPRIVYHSRDKAMNQRRKEELSASKSSSSIEITEVGRTLASRERDKKAQYENIRNLIPILDEHEENLRADEIMQGLSILDEIHDTHSAQESKVPKAYHTAISNKPCARCKLHRHATLCAQILNSTDDNPTLPISRLHELTRQASDAWAGHHKGGTGMETPSQAILGAYTRYVIAALQRLRNATPSSTRSTCYDKMTSVHATLMGTTRKMATMGMETAHESCTQGEPYPLRSKAHNPVAEQVYVATLQDQQPTMTQERELFRELDHDSQLFEEKYNQEQQEQRRIDGQFTSHDEITKRCMRCTDRTHSPNTCPTIEEHPEAGMTHNLITQARTCWHYWSDRIRGRQPASHQDPYYQTFRLYLTYAWAARNRLGHKYSTLSLKNKRLTRNWIPIIERLETRLQHMTQEMKQKKRTEAIQRASQQETTFTTCETSKSLSTSMIRMSQGEEPREEEIVVRRGLDISLRDIVRQRMEKRKEREGTQNMSPPEGTSTPKTTGTTRLHTAIGDTVEEIIEIYEKERNNTERGMPTSLAPHFATIALMDRVALEYIVMFPEMRRK